MERRELFQREGAWAGWIRTDAGVDYDSYIYVLRGTLTIDYGPSGGESVRAAAGDFIFNPANVVHRETTSADGDAEAFLVRIGSGPQLVNVAGPD